MAVSHPWLAQSHLECRCVATYLTWMHLWLFDWHRVETMHVRWVYKVNGMLSDSLVRTCIVHMVYAVCSIDTAECKCDHSRHHSHTDVFDAAVSVDGTRSNRMDVIHLKQEILLMSLDRANSLIQWFDWSNRTPRKFVSRRLQLIVTIWIVAPYSYFFSATNDFSHCNRHVQWCPYIDRSNMRIHWPDQVWGPMDMWFCVRQVLSDLIHPNLHVPNRHGPFGCRTCTLWSDPTPTNSNLLDHFPPESYIASFCDYKRELIPCVNSQNTNFLKSSPISICRCLKEWMHHFRYIGLVRNMFNVNLLLSPANIGGRGNVHDTLKSSILWHAKFSVPIIGAFALCIPLTMQRDRFACQTSSIWVTDWNEEIRMLLA